MIDGLTEKETIEVVNLETQMNCFTHKQIASVSKWCTNWLKTLIDSMDRMSTTCPICESKTVEYGSVYHFCPDCKKYVGVDYTEGKPN